jgi:GT2 family glycosyltransferase
MKKFDLTLSVVLYKNDPAEIKKLVDCIAQTELNYRLFLIDNSPTDLLKIFTKEKNTEYYFNNKNIGFGRAQNVAINKALNQSKYHLILNPDISFEKGALENMYAFMEQNRDIGQLMPKVCYHNGNVQRLCKLLPRPLDLIGRRFFNNYNLFKKRNKVYELNGFDYNKILDTPSLSGCFMFIRMDILKQVKGFDPRFFMYLEDFDMTRRIHKITRTIFYPYTTIVHKFNKGSFSDSTLFVYHTISAIKYFNKWGWFLDKERDILNKKVLSQIQEKGNVPLDLSPLKNDIT